MKWVKIKQRIGKTTGDQATSNVYIKTFLSRRLRETYTRETKIMKTADDSGLICYYTFNGTYCLNQKILSLYKSFYFVVKKIFSRARAIFNYK